MVQLQKEVWASREFSEDIYSGILQEVIVDLRREASVTLDEDIIHCSLEKILLPSFSLENIKYWKWHYVAIF